MPHRRLLRWGRIVRLLIDVLLIQHRPTIIPIRCLHGTITWIPTCCLHGILTLRSCHHPTTTTTTIHSPLDVGFRVACRSFDHLPNHLLRLTVLLPVAVLGVPFPHSQHHPLLKNGTNSNNGSGHDIPPRDTTNEEPRQAKRRIRLRGDLAAVMRGGHRWRGVICSWNRHLLSQK